MWEHVRIVRDGAELERALDEIDAIEREAGDPPGELRNLRRSIED